MRVLVICSGCEQGTLYEVFSGKCIVRCAGCGARRELEIPNAMNADVALPENQRRRAKDLMVDVEGLEDQWKMPAVEEER